MASIGSDLEEVDQTKINEVAKLFSTEMRKYAVGLQVPAAILKVMQATYLFAGRDTLNYHLCFVETAGTNTLNYKDLTSHGIVPLSAILHQLRIEIGEPLWAFSVPIKLTGDALNEHLQQLGRQYVDTILQSQKTPGKRPSEDALGIPEIASGIERFRKDYPQNTRTAFIIMSFQGTKLHALISETIKEALKAHGIVALRADDKEYMDDLLPNVRTYMHGCDFAVAVFERITEDDFNPNVSLEVGYMMGLGKNVLLLKDKTLKSLQADLVGRLYKPFDPQEVKATVPDQITKWLSDKGLV